MLKTKIIQGDGFDGISRALRSYKAVYMIYDRNVSQYAEEIQEKNSKRVIASLAIDVSESVKTLGTVINISSWLLEKGADRSSLVLSVGGGCTSDIVGFTASIYYRGVDYANVPTTLLAQVDAAIGGKTGVNFESYKNILGVIRQPVFTYISTHVLETLSRKEFKSGAAELLKTFIIFDEERYEKTLWSLNSSYSEHLRELILKAAEYKLKLVKRDPDEKGRRKLLNLGHSYAHAIEWYQQKYNVSNPLSHGEAVAVGIVYAARLSEKKHICKTGLADKIVADFTTVGLPTAVTYPEDIVSSAISKDKKKEGNKMNFVLIKRIGKVGLYKL